MHFVYFGELFCICQQFQLIKLCKIPYGTPFSVIHPYPRGILFVLLQKHESKVKVKGQKCFYRIFSDKSHCFHAIAITQTKMPQSNDIILKQVNKEVKSKLPRDQLYTTVSARQLPFVWCSLSDDHQTMVTCLSDVPQDICLTGIWQSSVTLTII